MKRLVFVVWLLLMCTAVKANDSAVQGVGGTVAPMKQHPTVRMVNEKVDVRLGKDGAIVKCRFVFRNEGPATIVKFGFPEHAGGDVSPIEKSAYKHFKSWVDGQRIQAKFVPSAKDNSGSYKAWHVKDVPFKANQTRVIEDEYSSLYGDTIGDSWFYYILRSGKNWKGSIGEAVITVDASDVWSYWQPEPGDEYPGYVRKGKTIVWNLKNFEPENDIRVDLNPRWMLYMGDPSNGYRLTVNDPELFGNQGIAMVSIGALKPTMTIEMVGKKISQGIKIYYQKDFLLIYPGSKKALMNGKTEITLPHAPYIDHGTTYIPIITVVKALGIPVVRDANRGMIIIQRPEKTD